MKKWIFLSAHFDDVVLSIGGLVWELTQSGNHVEIWTICAGDPPMDHSLTDYAQLLHGFWDIGENVPQKRSIEDSECCRILGVAIYRRYTVPDNIYRYLPGTNIPIIKENMDQFKPLEPEESYLIPQVSDFIRKNLPNDSELVAPLAIGAHRDHILTRLASERLQLPIWHYADLPYLIYGDYKLADWLPENAESFAIPISADGLKAWQNGFACQRSQIPLVFTDEDDMRSALEKYWKSGFGNTLWRF